MTESDDDADASVHDPKVTGAPDAIWLVYGDIERDSTHAECCASGEVTWCEDAQFTADVRYTRTDLVAERVRSAAAAERVRCITAVFAWAHEAIDRHAGATFSAPTAAEQIAKRLWGRTCW